MLYSRTPPWPCDLPKDLYRSCCTQLTPERSLVRSQYRPRSRGVSCARGVRGLARSLSVPGGATPKPRPAGLRPPDPLAGSACIRLAGSACIRASRVPYRARMRCPTTPPGLAAFLSPSDTYRRSISRRRSVFSRSRAVPFVASDLSRVESPVDCYEWVVAVADRKITALIPPACPGRSLIGSARVVAGWRWSRSAKLIVAWWSSSVGRAGACPRGPAEGPVPP